jgi:hypothetical protein
MVCGDATSGMYVADIFRVAPSNEMKLIVFFRFQTRMSNIRFC